MLSEERINKLHDDVYVTAAPTQLIGRFRFARAIEREATAPLIEQIEEDEALMRRVLDALLETPRYPGSTPNQLGATEALRQRLEAKK